MKGNVINLNTLHLNSVRLNGIGKVQSVSLKGGSTEDPVFPPVEPPIEPPIEPEPTPTYTLSASVANGVVSATLNGVVVSLPFTANEGDVIVVSVTPNDGYAFEGWVDGNTDNPRSITMTADVALSAQCVEVVQPPVGNYIQFEDKAVEAICVANWSSDGIGLTMEEAAAVTTIGSAFSQNKEITSFDEFRYFTGVTSLSFAAFSGCSNLATIDLSNITEIKAEAFRNCTELSIEVIIPNVANILKQTFVNTKITKLVAENIVTIESSAFGSCANLKEVDLGISVQSIGWGAFSGCSALESVAVRATTPPSLAAEAFKFSTCPIYVPDASLEAYKTATNWNTYADRIKPLSVIEGDDSRLDYIHDSMLMWLDGKDKGTIEGEWQDLVGGGSFVNHGAIAEADGWRFDGDSSYMDSTTVTGYGPGFSDRTIEAVVEFERENTTEIVYMGSSGGYSFGRYAGERCIILQSGGYELGFPSLADDMKKGVRVVSVSASNFQIVASKINGNDGQVSYSNLFSGSISAILLGKRASGNHFKGIIHSIRIHDRILSEEEILYNQRIDNKRFNLGLDI